MTSEPPVPPEGAPAPRGQVPFELSEAFNYGWLKFQQNVGPILVATLVLIVGAAAVSFIWYLVTLPFTAMDPEDISDVGAVGFLFTGAVFAIVFVLVGFIVQAGIVRGGLAITKGQPLEVGAILSTENLGQVILTAVLIGIGTSIGTALCVLPGIVFAFFSQFAMHFVVDKGMSATDAIRASFQIVNRNLASTIGLYLGVLVANTIGALLCGIGLLVSVPVSIIATAFAYRRMNGETVAA